MENTNDKTAVALPGHPEPHTHLWTALEKRAIEKYGAARAEEARREAAEHWNDTKEWAIKQAVEKRLNEARRHPDAAQRTAGGDAVPDVDELAQFIRAVDGNHSMGAGALAEKICEYLAAQPVEEAAAQVDDDVLKALKKAAGLLRAAGFCMTGTATSQIVAAINAASICTTPPPGWQCTRPAGHDGPCAAIPAAALTARPTLPSAGKESPCAN